MVRAGRGDEEMLRLAAESFAGYALVLEYLNRAGSNFVSNLPLDDQMHSTPGESRSCLGVPERSGSEFFREACLELGDTLKIGHPRIGESIRHAPGWELLRCASGESVSAASAKPPRGYGRGGPPQPPTGGHFGLLAGPSLPPCSQEAGRVIYPCHSNWSDSRALQRRPSPSARLWYAGCTNRGQYRGANVPPSCINIVPVTPQMTDTNPRIPRSRSATQGFDGRTETRYRSRRGTALLNSSDILLDHR